MIGLIILMLVQWCASILMSMIHENLDSLDPIIDKIAHIIQTHRQVDTRP